MQGGLERIEVRSKKVTHLYPDRDTRGIGFMERDGIATLNSQQVVVDENNKVWVAHKSHSIFSGASPGNPGVFILTPGTFSSRRADDYQGKFNSISTWQDRREGNEDPHLPYPAYTYNPGPEGTPQGRNLQSIATDNSFVWISVFPYEAHETGKFFQSRLLQYTLEGVFVKETTIQEAGFSGGVFNDIYSNNKELWATSSFVDGGFSVFKDNKWHKINSRALFPEGTRFNQGAIWGDDYGRVYLGTNNGLIVYNGIGSVLSEESYTLYTKDSCNPSNVRCIKDIDMLSNNIISGISEKSIEGTLKGYYSWIATDKGIMRSFFSSGQVTVYHLKDKKKYFEEANYFPMVELLDARVTDPEIENIPSFAVDRTTSSVFRYWTDNVKEFYTDEDRVFYKIINKSSTENLTEDQYTARYGKITKKKLDQYVIGTTVKPEDLKYVDLILEHPRYIKKDDFVPSKNYADFDFIIEWGEKGNTIRVFEHPVRVSLPPILLAHGVWTDISSLDKLEKYFVGNVGYRQHEIYRAWRKNKEEAEKPFGAVANIIPDRIDSLREQAYKNKVSAGKVNIIAHSRGGLYTRAYIEEIGSEIYSDKAYNYKEREDINSLITLNTPHYGSH